MNEHEVSAAGVDALPVGRAGVSPAGRSDSEAGIPWSPDSAEGKRASSNLAEGVSRSTKEKS